MEDLLRPRDSLDDREFGFGGVEHLPPKVADAIRKAERQHFQQAPFADNDQTLRGLLMMMLCDDFSAELARDFLHIDSVALDAGHAPAASGDSAAFATAVQDAMSRFQRRFPLCTPLELPISLHVVFTPTVHGIDADNLARKIVPIVVERLRPPTTLIHTVDLATIDDPRRRQHIERFLEGYRRVPWIALTKYEVTRVPRSPPDPDHGFVKLSLGDGTTHDSLLGPILSHVEEWADKVERSAR